MEFALLDTVTLAVDTPELLRGQLGTIVMCLAQNVFEVEFAGEDGVAIAILTLEASQLRKEKK